MGNIMNTGSKNEQSVGFDISYLPKLSNTKDRDNKLTLLHFLVETIEKSHPHLLTFYVSTLYIIHYTTYNIVSFIRFKVYTLEHINN